jgi:serine/threonine protein kinase
MTAHDADAGALTDQYRDLKETARSAEFVRYSAALSDGAPVSVVVLGQQLAERIQHPKRFLDTLERASGLGVESLARPVVWGQSADGLLHCAYPRASPRELAPGTHSAAEVATIGAGLARGLATAHTNGLSHGAICTGRIEQTSTGTARLNEFGLFAALCAGGATGREATSALCGGPYLSPEQESGGMSSEQCDIYALGASLFELLTGKPPFGGRTTSYTMATLLSERDAEQPDAARDRRVVVNALLRAIERAPDDRWSSAAVFASALESDDIATVADKPTSSAQRLFAIFRNAWFPARRSRE